MTRPSVCEALRAKWPGLGAREYGRSVASRNGFFDRNAVADLNAQLLLVISQIPVGSEILGDEIVLFRTSRPDAVGFYFLCR